MTCNPDIIREILSDEPNILKRNLKVYNLIHCTSYTLEDLGFIILDDMFVLYCYQTVYKMTYIKEETIIKYNSIYNEVCKWFTGILSNSIHERIGNYGVAYHTSGSSINNKILKKGYWAIVTSSEVIIDSDYIDIFEIFFKNWIEYDMFIKDKLKKKQNIKLDIIHDIIHDMKDIDSYIENLKKK